MFLISGNTSALHQIYLVKKNVKFLRIYGFRKKVTISKKLVKKETFDLNGYRYMSLGWHILKLSTALCKFCVLFKQKVHRGLQSSFILKGFKKYKDFNEAARNHIQSEWHKRTVLDGTNLMIIKEKKKLSITNLIFQTRIDLIIKNCEKLGLIYER